MKKMIVRWKKLTAFGKFAAILGAIIGIPLFLLAAPLALLAWGLACFKTVVLGE